MNWMSENYDYYPPPGYRYLFTGNDVPSIDGYVDSIGIPAGIRLNIGIRDLRELLDHPEEMEEMKFIKTSAFRNVMLFIGLDLTGECNEINSGAYDFEIKALGDWIKTTSRPVFLGMGTGLDPDLTSTNPEDYSESYIRITTILRDRDIKNVRTIWPYGGTGYPGDAYVNGVSYSYSERGPEEASRQILNFAAEHNLPVFLIAAAPRYTGLNQDESLDLWENWYDPFLKHIEDHAVQIKAVSLRNVQMQEAPLIRKRWINEMKTPAWIHRTLIDLKQGE